MKTIFRYYNNNQFMQESSAEIEDAKLYQKGDYIFDAALSEIVAIEYNRNHNTRIIYCELKFAKTVEQLRGLK